MWATIDSQNQIQTLSHKLLCVSAQIRETLSGRILVCRVQLSQDLWVFDSQRDRTYGNTRLRPSMLMQQDVRCCFKHLFMLNFCHSHFVFCFFVLPRQITMSAPLSIPTPMFYSVHHFRYCFVLMATQLQMHTAVLILISQVQSLYEKSMTCVYGSVQAVPYSREFKQKYDYFRKKLKKPVRAKFQLTN